MESPALPEPKGHFQPRPCCSIGAPSGSGPTSRRARAVGLAEGVAADDQRGGLLVVHRHPAERLSDVDARRPADPACPRGLRD